MASIRIKNQTWYACIALPGKKRTQVSTKKKDIGTPAERAEARRQAKDIAQNLESLMLGDSSEIQIRSTLNALFERVGKRNRLATPVETFITEWLDRAKLHKAAGTYRRYAAIAESFLKSLGARRTVALAEVTIRDVQRWLDAELATGKRIGSVAIERGALGIPFSSALKQGLISINPVALAELPKYKRRTTRQPFSEVQIAQILSVATGDWFTACMIGAFTGARLSDAVNMRWASVDLDNGVLRYLPHKTERTGDEVVIPLHPALAAHLTVLRNEAGQQPGGFLCPSLADRAVGCTGTLCKHFKDLLKRAGIETEPPPEPIDLKTTRRGRHRTPRYSFHSFRFSFASRLANAGVSRELRMKLVGHTTEQIHNGYTHLALETLRGAVLQLPALSPGPEAAATAAEQAIDLSSGPTGPDPRGSGAAAGNCEVVGGAGLVPVHQ